MKVNTNNSTVLATLQVEEIPGISAAIWAKYVSECLNIPVSVLLNEPTQHKGEIELFLRNPADFESLFLITYAELMNLHADLKRDGKYEILF